MLIKIKKNAKRQSAINQTINLLDNSDNFILIYIFTKVINRHSTNYYNTRAEILYLKADN